jgi:hypothetical protein
VFRQFRGAGFCPTERIGFVEEEAAISHTASMLS